MTPDNRHPIDTDPLGAIQNELVAAARRQLAARRRRRRMLATGATVVGLLTLTSGAVALTDIGTGVTAIDRFLNTASEPLRHPTTGPHPERHTWLPPSAMAPPAPSLRPTADSVSPPLQVSLSNETHALAVGYQSRDGSLCAALADPEAPIEQPQGFLGCVGAPALANALKKSVALLVARSAISQSSVMIQGFAREEVRSVDVISPTGRFHAALSDAWIPGTWQAGRLRVFLTVVEAAPESDKTATPVAGLRLEAKLADGSSVEVRP